MPTHCRKRPSHQPARVGCFWCEIALLGKRHRLPSNVEGICCLPTGQRLPTQLLHALALPLGVTEVVKSASGALHESRRLSVIPETEGHDADSLVGGGDAFAIARDPADLAGALEHVACGGGIAQSGGGQSQVVENQRLTRSVPHLDPDAQSLLLETAGSLQIVLVVRGDPDVVQP